MPIQRAFHSDSRTQEHKFWKMETFFDYFKKLIQYLYVYI